MKRFSGQQLRAISYKVKLIECIRILCQIPESKQYTYHHEVEVFDDLSVSNQEGMDAGT